MSNKKKTSAKKKSNSAKKPSAKKSLPKKVEKIQITVPTPEEVKDIVTDTWKAFSTQGKFTPEAKKGLLARIKSWWKVS